MCRPHLQIAALLLWGAMGCSGDKKATAVPASLSLSPSTLAFKTTALGTAPTLVLTLNAQTPAPVLISSVTISDSGDGSATAFQISGTPAQVPADSSATLTVTFTPTVVRAYAATLTVNSNDDSLPIQKVALTGTGGARQVSVALQDPDGATAILSDGGLSIDFLQPPGGASGIAWPEVLLSNGGAVAANLTGFHFANGDAGFFLPTVPDLPQVIAPEQIRTFEVAFAAPAGNTGTHLGDALVLDFDDPNFPEATIDLAAEVQPAFPPVACAFVASAQELDGSIERASAGAVAVEPGALVELTAFADDLGDAGSPACSYDPQTGRNGLAFGWSVTAAPPGSQAVIASPSDPRPSFIPDLPGDYQLALQVSDSSGLHTSAQVGFTAAPLEDLTVKLSWPGQRQVDLDLHLVRPGGRPFSPGDDVSSLADGGLDWGTPGDPTDDPHFSGDDQGDGALEESVWIDRPQDGCLTDGGCSYGVWVHYFQDRRALDGGSCGLSACFEGTACGCAGDEQVCEPGPTGDSCAGEVAPEIQVFLKGQISPALTVPLSGAALSAVALPSPCFTWHALQIAVQLDGGISSLAPLGDGGDVEYWGDHTNDIRECVAGAGGYAATSPPLLSP